ncbi:MAG: HAD hydrolase family protein [Gammaproteobacteria bacterium]|nr:MAG: HAD hydrolase family protein [Gammaproteobacteria bacterium]
MGKLFEKELEQFDATYKWALSIDVSVISDLIKSTWSFPLLSVGSGGSFSVAEFHALLHKIFYSSIVKAVTPVELISALPRNAEASVWFMSASGNNVDIYRAYKHTILREMNTVSAIVGRKGSKLNKLSKKHEYTNCFEYFLPSGKDGFLATNSLLAFTTLLYRAYSDSSDEIRELPKTTGELINKCIFNYSELEHIKKTIEPLWDKQSLHVLYSLNLKPAALDIESKFTESGLISTHLADIRNFAHGRHHWFAKHQNDSGIIALSTKNDYEIVEKTLGLLPNTVPKVHVSFNSLGGIEAIAGIILSMYLTKWLGKVKGIDPGRPGVPPFGSKIYRLSANPGFVTSINKKKAAIERKRKLSPLSYDTISEKQWDKAYGVFIKTLSEASIGGIVLDYDGTVVDSNKRWDPPSNSMAVELIRLLEEGVIVGFATGRGKSIRRDLQQVIPKKFWSKILIGYYNGSELKNLSNNNYLNTASDPVMELESLFKKLKDNIFLSELASFDQKKYQLTVKRKDDKPLSETFLWDLVQDELYQCEEHKGEVLRSSHSIDIIARDISKLSVVEEIKKEIDEHSEILSIGDRGRWPGNDARLLKENFSLSVDEVSYSPVTCWNLCPAGIRGAQGTLYYLSRLKRKNGSLRFFP